jgi:hypothetical protein
LSKLLDDLAAAQQSGPERIFEFAIAVSNSIDAKRFLIENLLEEVKRGADIYELMVGYHNIGLLRANAKPERYKSDDYPVGAALVTRKILWKRVAIDT